jgi:hypothetical protein
MKLSGMAKPPKVDVSALVQEHLEALADGKAGYETADDLMDEIELEVTPGEIVEVRHGELKGRYRLTDKFESKHKIFAGRYIRRFEFERLSE